jgi:hypothetical protein
MAGARDDKDETEEPREKGLYSENGKEFCLKEYEALRKEVEWLLQDYRTLERYAIVAVGVSWAWLFHEQKTVPVWAWWFPVLFAVLGGVRAYGILKAFKALGKYLKTVEDFFYKEGGPSGWEHREKKGSSTSLAAGTFWAILIAATLGVVLNRWLISIGELHQ